MKKITCIITLVTLMVTSCSKDETIRTIKDEQPVIGFTSISDRLVKATETTISNLGAFKVTGFYYTTTNPNYLTDAKLFFETDVTAASDGTCTYDPLKYWPTTGKIDFFAYKHITLGTLTATEVPFSYSVPTEVADQKDVVVAKAMGQSKPNPIADVPLKFHHALSQIKFAARSGINGVKFDLTEITLMNILSDGSSELVNWTIPTTVTADGNGLSWTASGTAKDYSAGLADNTGIPYSTTDYRNITAANGALMLIPQSTASTAGTSGKTAVAGKTYIKVHYKTYDNTTNAKLSEGDYFYGLNATWKPGVRYTYKISFNNASSVEIEPITFEASVEDWVEDDKNVII